VINDNLGIIEKIIVELKGDPSYTSGDQKWNGAQEILNNNVEVINIIPIKIIYSNVELFSEKGKDNSIVKALKFNVPKAKYNKLLPSKKKPEIKAPDMKYFKPASAENEESRLKLANT